VKQLQYLPAVDLDIDGNPCDATLMRCLASARVQQRLSLPTLAEFVFRDPPGPLDRVASLAVGAKVRCDVDRSGVSLIEGEITAVEHVFLPDGEREIRVRVYDATHRLRKRQPVRAHTDVTPAGLTEDLVEPCGLEVQAAADGPARPRLLQYQLTDLEVLQQALVDAGLYFTARQKVLHVLSLDGIGPAVTVRYGHELIEARLEVNGDSTCRSVDAEGWNPLTAAHYQAVAGDARSGRRTDATAPPDAFGCDGLRTVAAAEVIDDDHARSLAQAELDRRIGREVTVWAVVEGDARLRPGAWMDLDTPASAFNGRHVLTSATHQFDHRHGYITEVSSAVPVIAASPQPPRTTVGVVIDVDDPDGLGRVRVSLPALGELETDWVGVLLPAAGDGKGVIALPAPDDRVLVLLGASEASQAIVLGGLYGTTPPPDPGVEGDRVVRYTIKTPSGQRITLADDARSVRVEDGNGTSLEMNPDRMLVHSVVDIEMSAPGRRLLFRGAKIDFEQA
jgi:phage baseplate assembly protein gpV